MFSSQQRIIKSIKPARKVRSDRKRSAERKDRDVTRYELRLDKYGR